MTRPKLVTCRRALVIALTVLLTEPVWAHVTGTYGIAPTLPPEIPGIDRPFPHDTQKFTFAIIGDKTGGGERNWHIFDRAMDEVSRLRPDFALMVGDLIQGYTPDAAEMQRQWQEFSEHAERIEVPFFYLPGNHDISNKAMYEYWSANVGKTYYSFDYKGCHFVLLNTEEGWRADELQFGSEQMAWLEKDLVDHRTARHTFLFMHKPVWYHTGDALAQWEQVEKWLEARSYAVFAGHFHNLSYEQRRDRPYFVLSATGAGLTPRAALDLGAFHHYTTVTVDGGDLHIAIIEPGSVHPHDIAPREVSDRAREIIAAESRMPQLNTSGGDGEHVFHLKNPLSKSLTARVEWTIPDGSSWRVIPSQATYVLKPGESADAVFRAVYGSEGLLALPSYRYTLTYGDSELWSSTGQLSPMDIEKMTSVTQWRVVGPFLMDASGAPPAGQPTWPDFLEAWGPEQGIQDTYQTEAGPIGWRDADAEANGWLDMNAIFGGDYRIGHALSHVYSPDERVAIAGILWSDDVTRVLVNGEVVVPVQGYNEIAGTRFFLMPLKPGWNALLVKNGDGTGNWGFTIRVSDPDGVLKFARQVP